MVVTDTKTRAPYGSWVSALSAQAVAAGGARLDNVRVADGVIYWTENLPSEGGRIALWRFANGMATTVSPPGSNVRTRVHEYGGAPYGVAGSRIVYSQYSDQKLYGLDASGEARPISPLGYRYADLAPVPDDGVAHGFWVGVREDHTDPNRIVNAVVRLSVAEPGAGHVLYEAADFVAYPRVNAQGNRLAFIRWNHPDMPWDATQLVVGELTANSLGTLTAIAGIGDPVSVLDPKWAPNGDLYFLADHSNYWNLYVWDGHVTRCVWSVAAELASPLWTLGQSNYALVGSLAVARVGEQGIDRLARVDLLTGTAEFFDLPYVRYAQIQADGPNHVVMLAASADAPLSIVRLDVRQAQISVVRQAGSARLEPRTVSKAQRLAYPSTGGRLAHAFYYPPCNPAFEAAPSERPPVIAFVHGGPTAQALPDYSPSVQYWTTRGFAVVDVNYAGSAGFGRAYRQALNGAWGVADVEDVISAISYLTQAGLVDNQRTAISGGSAGGFTVLVALATSDVFHAGADYYGVSDMSALARDTHKFESRYLDSLIGPLPQSQAIYDSRSPLNHLDGFKAPLIVFQGAEDPIVPPNQSELIVNALRARRAPVAYLLYPGEAHGFRRSENIIRSLQAELTFYGRVFGFTPADDLPELLIENLP